MGIDNRRNLRQIKECFLNFWGIGVHKCIVIGLFREELRISFKEKPWCVVHNQEAEILTRTVLPPGPELIWIEKGVRLKQHHLMCICYLEV